MKKFSFLFFISINIFCSAQEKESITPKIELSAISQINQGNSYITFPTDIGNIEHLWFEGNVIPNFFIKKNKNSRLIGVLTPQIIIRMYQKESFPVQTPSYFPQISFYYSISDKFIYKNLTLFGRFAHHSNGQEGDFYSSNGTINLKSGNFTTNYFETGLIKTNFNTRLGEHQFFKTSIEIHPQSWMSEDLVGKYSNYRWHTAVSFFKIESKKTPKKASISLKAETGWMLGGINNWKNFSSDRLNFKLTFFYHPDFFNEVGLFVQFYHGMDYYNIYFNHHLDIVRFGIMTEILNF